MAASNYNQDYGTAPLSQLLREQAIPSSIGILTLSLNGIIDTIFVGRYVGAEGIGAITVVLPIMYLMASIGMAIGVGGSSIVSRAMGAENQSRADLTWGNMVGLTIGLSTALTIACFVAQNAILGSFGAQGGILQPSRDYFSIILIGVPPLAWAMMTNNVIRAVGAPRVAMRVLIIAAVVNMILDPVFIVWLDWGMTGAGWATTIAYICSAVFTAGFFIIRDTGLRFHLSALIPNPGIIREMGSLGFVTLARQASVSLFYMLLNNTLFRYGGEIAISSFGIVNRFMLFAIFPILGITQGSVPIIGFNYGAALWQRVRDMIYLSIRTATIIALLIFVIIMVFTPYLVQLFTTDIELINTTVPVMRTIFFMTPLLAINLIGSAYYQSIGKAIPALFLTLTRQVIFLIPLVILLPIWLGLRGVWLSFPIADLGAALITYVFLRKQMKLLSEK